MAAIVILSIGFKGEPYCILAGGWIRDQGQSPTDPCPDPKNIETPWGEKFYPAKLTWAEKYLKVAWPTMAGQELWCNDDAVLLMYNDFRSIDSLFGNCPICSTNLKRFWWEYTCSPYQGHFVEAYEQIRVPDVDYPCLNVSMRVGNMVAWDLFNSCVKNPYVASLASGQSAPGFLEFMGSNAVQEAKTKISFVFSNDPDTSLLMDMYPWNKNINGTIDGYHVEPWTWNYWETACKPNDINAMPSFFDGFNIVVVVIVYAALIILSIIIYFIKRKYGTEQEEYNTNLIDSDSDKIYGSDDGSQKQRLIDASIDSKRDRNYNKNINASSIKDSVQDNITN